MVYKSIECPTCGGQSVVKHGKTETNKQRYLCQNPTCSRQTFVTDNAIFQEAIMKAILCLILVLVIAGFSSAATIHVPGDQPTIQAGINAASDGDTVLVADGTYTGKGNKDLDFNGKAITVKSENGPENCIINCR